MAVDTSALLAIVLGEPEGPACSACLLNDTEIVMSADTFAETLIVAQSRNVVSQTSTLIDDLCVQISAVTAESARRSAYAYMRFGRGRHPAGLNYGDCFSYEIAVRYDCPLLFVGDDFTQTDVKRAR